MNTPRETRITDQLDTDQVYQVIQHAERGLDHLHGDRLAQQRELVQRARTDYMAWERNKFKAGALQESLEHNIRGLMAGAEDYHRR